MAQSLNSVQLIGNLGSDPEVRTTPSGAKVANFRVACSESWKDQSGQKQERTEWVTCVAWKVQAEIAEKYLRKGSRLYVEGKLQTRTWEDKNGGGKRYATEVLVERFMMLDGRPGPAAEANRGSGDDDNPMRFPTSPAPTSDDDLPF
jgi:single-strand DNA-binding protein